MHYHWDFYFLLHYMPLFWRGLVVTLAYTAATILIGLLIGLLVGLGRLSKSWVVNAPLIAFIEAFRCTPLLVQIVWFYYALPVLLNIQIPAVVAAGLTLSCYTGAFYAEIFRGGIISIEQGQWDAARALGLGRWQMMRRVILPQAIRRMIPPFVNQSITQLKNTSLVSTIAVPDLLYNGELITADTYRPLETYTVIALIYFLILFPSTIFAQAYERRLTKRPK
ncbi:MAG TPA: amino acid ABC transporter permease [Rhodopila sp.]|uniref:amino acid ABC transporter permease n=1 Tax=Rhodopila sp. TaxID=2480087 RepID=UPI002BCDE946|nr:amino acid ABC transporter permease [Rhodopila sp.]HVY15160.1 amino acid ABC transporter permease [Rhodopila sp.]